MLFCVQVEDALLEAAINLATAEREDVKSASFIPTEYHQDAFQYRKETFRLCSQFWMMQLMMTQSNFTPLASAVPQRHSPIRAQLPLVINFEFTLRCNDFHFVQQRHIKCGGR